MFFRTLIALPNCSSRTKIITTSYLNMNSLGTIKKYCNSSAFGFLLHAASHAKAASRLAWCIPTTMLSHGLCSTVQSPRLNCNEILLQSYLYCTSQKSTTYLLYLRYLTHEKYTCTILFLYNSIDIFSTSNLQLFSISCFLFIKRIIKIETSMKTIVSENLA